jgi:hypothetical protein
MMTPNIKHLPDAPAGVAAKQGWDDTSLIIHLMGFIEHNVRNHEKLLELYFGAMADEENGDFEV